MNIGDYVRTKKGTIYQFNSTSSKALSGAKKYMVKSSPNIIDLIEVGDYVNGKKVIKIWEEPFGEFAGQIFTILEGEVTAPTIREIKSIVTKEQFSQMEYKVGE